jgi:hypothetical protein
MVPDAKKIKTFEQVDPYFYSRVNELISQEDHPDRLIGDLLPELESYISPNDDADELTNLLYYCDLMSSNLSAIRVQSRGNSSDPLHAYKPDMDELLEMYRESSLYSLIEDMTRIYL